MGEAHLAGMGNAASTDEAGLRRGVMRRAERSLGDETAVAGQQPADTPYHRDLDGLLERERRQDRGQPSRQHGLAGAGRSEHDDVVAAGGRDLQRSLGMGMPPHVGEIRPVGPSAAEPSRGVGAGGLDGAFAVQVLDGLVARPHRDHLHGLHHGSFGGVVGGHDQRRVPVAAAVERHGEDATHRPHTAVQGQLAQDEGALEAPRFHQAGGAKNPEGHRQIEGGARLAEIGGGEIDGDALSGELEAGVPEGRADAIAALAHRGIGQAHRGEARQPRGDIHLHRHRGGFDALERGREDPRQHGGESEDSRPRRQRLKTDTGVPVGGANFGEWAKQARRSKFPDEITGRDDACCLRDYGFRLLSCSAQCHGGSKARFATKLSSRAFFAR